MDKNEFLAIYADYKDDLKYLVHDMLSSYYYKQDERVDEIMQICLAKVIKKEYYKKFETTSKGKHGLQSALKKIVTNQTIDEIRKKTRTDKNIQKIKDRISYSEILLEKIGFLKLKRLEKKILIQHLINGEKDREIAEKVQKKLSCVKKIRQRALNKLKKQIKNQTNKERVEGQLYSKNSQEQIRNFFYHNHYVLDDEELKIITKYYVEEKTDKQIAEDINKKTENVKKKRQRLVKNIADIYVLTPT